MQTWSGVHNAALTHNRIDLSMVLDGSGQLASNAAWQDGGSNSRADYNYLDGGGCTLNFAAGGQTQSSIFVDFNHFGRTRGFSGCVALISNESTMSTTITARQCLPTSSTTSLARSTRAQLGN